MEYYPDLCEELVPEPIQLSKHIIDMDTKNGPFLIDIRRIEAIGVMRGKKFTVYTNIHAIELILKNDYDCMHQHLKISNRWLSYNASLEKVILS